MSDNFSAKRRRAQRARGAPPAASRRKGEVVVELTEHLKRAILSGDFGAGEVLTEAKIMKAFGCSRTSCREALGLLLPSGLAVKMPNQSYRVASLDERDLYELTSMRLTMELLAASIAFDRPTFLSGMADAMEEMRQANERGDVVSGYQADRNFHKAIVRAAEHRRLEHAYALISDQVQLAFLKIGYRRRAISQIIEDHKSLFECASNGTIDAFLGELTAHVQGGLGVAFSAGERRLMPYFTARSPALSPLRPDVAKTLFGSLASESGVDELAPTSLLGW